MGGYSKARQGVYIIYQDCRTNIGLLIWAHIQCTCIYMYIHTYQNTYIHLPSKERGSVLI